MPCCTLVGSEELDQREDGEELRMWSGSYSYRVPLKGMKRIFVSSWFMVVNDTKGIYVSSSSGDQRFGFG